MPIEVDFKQPPPWVVVVQFSRQKAEVTWPFLSEGEARHAYDLAVCSGDFTWELRKATRNHPAFVVTMVSLWQLEWRPDIHDVLRPLYRRVDVPTEEAAP